MRACGEELGDAGGVEAVLRADQTQATGCRGRSDSSKIYKKQNVRRDDQETRNRSRSRSFCEGYVRGGLTDDNDGDGAKRSRVRCPGKSRRRRWRRRVPVGTTGSRGGGGGRMPRRRRSDAEAEAEAAADCCGGGGGSVERRKKPRERRRERSGNLAGRMGRVFLPRGNRWETGCNSRFGGLPKGARFWPREDWHGGGWPRKKAGILPGKWAAKGGLRGEGL